MVEVSESSQKINEMEKTAVDMIVLKRFTSI